MPIQAILFDFDGVVLDSLEVKTRAFYDMYLPHGEAVAKAVAAHHLEHGGMSRFDKFRHYHSTFLGIELSSDQVEELADEFSQRVLQGVIQSAEVKGVRRFLHDYHRDYLFFIITGTPTEEIRYITTELGLDIYFRGIYGSPERKDYWTRSILEDFQLPPEEVVFVGDALTDYDAALKNHTRFILREHADNLEFFEGKDLLRIRDFEGFEELIAAL